MSPDPRRRVLSVVDQENRQAYPDQPVRWFVLNVEVNVEVDITAADGLCQIQHDLDKRGSSSVWLRVKRDMLIPLRSAGLIALIGRRHALPRCRSPSRPPRLGGRARAGRGGAARPDPVEGCPKRTTAFVEMVGAVDPVDEAAADEPCRTVWTRTRCRRATLRPVGR